MTARNLAQQQRVLIVLLILLSPLCREERVPEGFHEFPLALQDYYLYDLGVADIDADGRLDIYTSNHSARSSILMGDGAGGFREDGRIWRLDQQIEFPGLEDSLITPEIGEGTGVFIFWHNRRLVIETHPASPASDFSGRLLFATAFRMERDKNCEFRIKQSPLNEDIIRTEIEFRFLQPREGGYLVLAPLFAAVPFEFRFDPGLPLEVIHVGSQMLPPPSHTFTLTLKDRHAMAWSDWDGSGRIGLFIAHGALGGNPAFFPDLSRHELLLRTQEGFYDVSREAGIVESKCRPRQSAWVDVDGDNRLDLFISGQASPNQLFRQRDAGRFIEEAEASGLADTEDGLGIWLDGDGDRDLDYFLAGRTKFWLYINRQGQFFSVEVGPNPAGDPEDTAPYRHFGRPVFADWDRDDDFDIYVASPERSSLLINTDYGWERTEPADIGLPAAALTACWVDIDNDGLIDLHSVPGGIYLQREGREFLATGILASDSSSPIGDARCTWFDMDNDGDRDAVLAVQLEDQERKWRTRLFRNSCEGHHWLQIQLIGPRGNAQAVGAGVRLAIPPAGTLMAASGAFEGSRYSQGHYRLYFGLGPSRKIEAITVFWPDGHRQVLRELECDRILTIEYQR